MSISWSTTRLTVGPCGRVRCEPGWRLDRQWSERLSDFDLWLVWAGRGRMKTQSTTVELRPGICFWMRPGGLYLAEQDPAHRLGVTFLHFDLRDARGRRLPASHLPAEIHDVDGLHLFDTVSQRVVELMQPPRPQVTVAENWLRTLLLELDRPPSDRGTVRPGGPTRRLHRQITEMAARIRENPTVAPPVAELARNAGYSADHFTRLFCHVTGLGPEAFIIRARITRAQQLLRETELPVGAVAEALGYCDPYFFSRQFKQQSGLTPLQFRRRAGRDFHV